MSDSVRKGKAIIICICAYLAIGTLVNNLIHFNLLNIILYVYIIFGLYYGHPKSRYIGAALNALGVVLGIYYIVQLARYGISIGYMMYYIVYAVLSAVVAILLLFNRNVEDYLYYMEVG